MNKWYEFLPLIAAAFFAIVVLNTFSKKYKDIRYEDLALGQATTSFFGKVDGKNVHCSGFDDVKQCLDPYEQEREKDLVVWLGNSQLHAINQMEPGDETAPVILHRIMARADRQYLMTMSLPNANLQEHYLLFEYLSALTQVRTVILPLVFDDLRETGIRDSLRPMFSETRVAEEIEKSAYGKKVLAYQPDETNNVHMDGIDDSVQDRVETYFNKQLAESIDIWAARSSLRGELFSAAYKLRNSVFGINPQTVRRVLPGPYNDNVNALKAMLDSAKSKNIRLIAYVAPIRNDITLPYDLEEYSQFKKYVPGIISRYGHKFYNLESIIPAAYWGEKDATSASGETEIDFMHFQGKGHEILSNTLAKILG